MSSGETEPRGKLILGADGNYVLAERTVWTRGRFRVYRVSGQGSREPWLELQHAGSRQERVFQFLGRDTLLLRDGADGYVVTDSGVDLFVRAPVEGPTKESGAWGTSLPGGSQPYDQAPVAITAAQPLYPQSARRGRITGTVVLRALVGKDGRVQDVQVVQGATGLTDAAVDAVRMWIFQPALKDGLPVTSWFEVAMDFKP
ncbi:MAG TPA: TonB family protein [Candidatus Eisenbacteria bacterium]|nr:TonB family protein [Candidatus Eisenbacteria bacterium]